MAKDNKVTITFDSFEDFNRFLMSPPRDRLSQIAIGETAHYSEVLKPSPAIQKQPVQASSRTQQSSRLTPQDAIIQCLRAWESMRQKPIPVSQLNHRVCAALGRRATQRELHSIQWHVNQLALKKKIHRVSRGLYSSSPEMGAKKAKRG